MPRLARAIAVGCAHHITQRGNNRQDVFFVDDGFLSKLEILLGRRVRPLPVGRPRERQKGSNPRQRIIKS